MKILFFFGTRPEAIKMAPVVREFRSDDRFETLLVVSAQHRSMLDQVLALFGLSADADLDVMQEGQTLTDITARVIQKFEPVLARFRPDLVLVHGDTTTTLGGALAAYYQKVPVGHVEAGLRTNDIYRPFPEEANRRLTDGLSTLFFAPTPESRRNLIRENVREEGIFVTGNTVIDALLGMAQKPRAFENVKLRALMRRLESEKRRVILMTAHRRENFGAPFRDVCAAVRSLSEKFSNVEWIYPVHPNPNVKGPAHAALGSRPNVHLLPPLDYADLVSVMKASTLVVTDSGGLQEEAPSLGKPVLVLRDVTERPEAVAAGTVKLVGTDRRKIIDGVTKLLKDTRLYRTMANAVNPYGDGRAAERIRLAVLWHFGKTRRRPEPFSPGRAEGTPRGH